MSAMGLMVPISPQVPMSKFEPEDFLNDRYAALEERLRIVRKRLNTPLTLAEKVGPAVPEPHSLV
jgi:hypothetical protein